MIHQQLKEHLPEIIGEAISRIFKIDSDIKISGAKTIADLRNKTIYDYDAVNHDIFWKIIIKDLPTLKAEVEIPLNN